MPLSSLKRFLPKVARSKTMSHPMSGPDVLVQSSLCPDTQAPSMKPDKIYTMFCILLLPASSSSLQVVQLG